MKRNKIISALLTASVALLTVSGCGSDVGSSSSSKDGSTSENAVELTYCVNSSNATAGFTLDPAVDYCASKSMAMGTCETLFVLNDETKAVECLLADSYEQADDLTWVINIKTGIKMSNGKELTAEACKKALEYIFENNTRLGTMADVSSIEADGQTLTIKTNEIVATLPRILSDPNTVIFDTEASDDYSKGLIGTGPYVLDSIDGEGNCELSRNDNYWQGMPKADKIHTKADLDPSAVTAALQSGEIDWGDVQDSDLALFENNEEYQVLESNTGRVYYLYLNPNYTFTEDPSLREAISYAIDRQAILDGVYGGHGNITTSIFPEWSSFYSSEYHQPDYDQEKAKSILKDAGYVDSDGDGIVEKDGENIKLNITCYDRNGFKTLSEVIQSMLKEVGIDSEIVVSDSIADDLMAGEYNIGTYGYNTLTQGDCYNFLQPVFETGASSNFTKFSDENVDKLLSELQVTSDETKRAELAQEMQKYIYEADEHLFLLHITNYTVARSNVKNLTAGFGGDQTNNSVLWQITKE